MVDIATMGATVGALLKERGQTVAVAESAAGGLICASLLALPGASAYFQGWGEPVYTGASKQLLMDLSSEAMSADRAATETHALHLAAAARTRTGELARPVCRTATLKRGGTIVSATWPLSPRGST